MSGFLSPPACPACGRSAEPSPQLIILALYILLVIVIALFSP